MKFTFNTCFETYDQHEDEAEARFRHLFVGNANDPSLFKALCPFEAVFALKSNGLLLKAIVSKSGDVVLSFHQNIVVIKG